MNKLCSYCKTKGRKIYDLGDTRVLKCSRCGFIYVDENFKYDEMLKLYCGDFYDEYLFNVENIEELTANELVKFIQKLKDKFDNKGKLLDFGCAKGNFLNKLKDYNLKLYGIDISPSSVEEGRKRFGLNLSCGDILKLNLKQDFFDFVTCWDVIEHLQNPDDILKELKRILAPGGYLLIRTPNEDSLITKILVLFYKLSFGTLKKHLKRIYNYHHINSFSPKVLSNWLEALGFEIVEVVQCQRYVTLYCLDKFNFFVRCVIKFLVWFSEKIKNQAAFVIYAKKRSL